MVLMPCLIGQVEWLPANLVVLCRYVELVPLSHGGWQTLSSPFSLYGIDPALPLRTDEMVRGGPSDQYLTNACMGEK